MAIPTNPLSATAAPAADRDTRVVELDGLRGLAVLMVVTCHVGPMCFQNPILAKLTSLGWVGVDLFFVLSGYLITGILIDNRGTDHYFRSFYMRRVLRIFPLYYGVITALSVSAAVFHRGPFQVPGEQIWYWLHLSNWHTAFGYSQWSKCVGHFWSLAIEEQFYLVWPLVVWFSSPKHLPRICILAVLLSLTLRNIPELQAMNAEFHGEFLYRITPFRLDGLALGALTAVGFRNPGFRVFADRLGPPAFGIWTLVCAAIALRHIPYITPIMSRVGMTAFPLLFALGLYLVRTRSPRLFRFRPLVSCGRYGYAMYLFHLPFADLFSRELTFLVPELVRFGIILGITYVTAWASWCLIERPILSLRKYFPY